jgi:hypothetical protein
VFALPLEQHTSMVRMSAQSWLDGVNTEYEKLHREFELQFWGTKMALSDAKYSVTELTRTKGEMEAFLADQEKLTKAREYLAEEELSEEQRKTFKMLERTFGCYIMESKEALELREACLKTEGALEAARNKMTLGATLADGSFVELSSVGLRSKMRVDTDESVRKACWEGLRTIGEYRHARPHGPSGDRHARQSLPPAADGAALACVRASPAS